MLMFGAFENFQVPPEFSEIIGVVSVLRDEMSHAMSSVS